VIIILLNVPLAAVGGVVGLALAGLPISVSALVGFVALFGISIQYGVLILERVRELELEDSQVEVFTTAKEMALSRLRPILMTSMMAALGLLPAALSHAVGAETARPFAVVIVGRPGLGHTAYIARAAGGNHLPPSFDQTKKGYCTGLRGLAA
jgi:heavy metal efflux system protein